MAKKRRKQRKAGDGIVVVLIVFMLVVVIAGAFFYVHTPSARDFSLRARERARSFCTAVAETIAPVAPNANGSGGTQPAARRGGAAVAGESARAGNVGAPEARSGTAAAGSNAAAVAGESCASNNSGNTASATATATPPAPTGGTNASAPESATVTAAPTATAHALVQLAAALEVPRCALTTHAADHELRQFADYALCYRESYELAEWSAYCLDRSELTKNASRSNDFRPDPAISTESASLADYRRSGYDRGHLAPAADFAYSAEAMSETFYMSNMTPQAPAFNRGIWQQLEAQVRSWAAEYGRAYVVTGPVLDAPATDYAAIGENAVAVPRAFYKIVLVPLYANDEDAATPDDCADVAVFAFIIPNEKCSASYFDYACSVDDVEALTGIDFFYQLDDSIETRLEAQKLVWQ